MCHIDEPAGADRADGGGGGMGGRAAGERGDNK
jgi:hypothetical protein